MNIFVNNIPEEIDDSKSSLKDLLIKLDLPDTGIGIGVNNKLIKAKDWDNFTLNQGDRVTIIRATYGG